MLRPNPSREGRASGKCLGLEGGALSSRISALTAVPYPMRNRTWMWSHQNPTMLTSNLRLPASRTKTEIYALYSGHLWYLVTIAQTE